MGPFIELFLSLDYLNKILVSLALFGLVGYKIYERYTEFKRQSERISQAESNLEREPEKAKPAWDLARTTLEAYFRRNLSQITSIFWLSVLVMMIGFGIIVWGISQSIQSPTTLAPAVLSSLAGIITEFIGATFLFIYRSTIKQAGDYSKTLERINSIGMAMQILDTIPDGATPDDLKNKTKAILVEFLTKQTFQAEKENKT
jgi:TRADD-N domain-containing protein